MIVRKNIKLQIAYTNFWQVEVAVFWSLIGGARSFEIYHFAYSRTDYDPYISFHLCDAGILAINSSFHITRIVRHIKTVPKKLQGEISARRSCNNCIRDYVISVARRRPKSVRTTPPHMWKIHATY